MADQDPFDSLRRQGSQLEERPSSNNISALPVGSLRFLRSQEALVSDLNTRKVQAEKETTGSSGSLAEVRRAFLQYDFPDYCNGRVPSGSGHINNRRGMGHGALAEKAILPVLPPPGEFPYAIRMTSEVTSSNGSSSMATVCGTVMALLDAGVPLLSPVAGISVGLAIKEDMEPSVNALVLDITGNEVRAELVVSRIKSVLLTQWCCLLLIRITMVAATLRLQVHETLLQLCSSMLKNRYLLIF